MKSKEIYVAFLRGINVGGHHKVPMAHLREELEKINIKNVTTLLNTGNIIFESNDNNLENKIAEQLEKAFGFSIPTIVRKVEVINRMLIENPFKDIKITNDIRLYVSFLKQEANVDLPLPWKSTDNAFEIIKKTDKTIFSVLDLSVTKTPKAMNALENYYGKEITTRNWKTIERIGKKTPYQTKK